MNDSKNTQAAIKWLREHNKCASKHPDGWLCTQTANHQGRKHKAQKMGGIEDGLLLKEWDW